MNPALLQLARELRLDDPEHAALRLAFGLACVERVAHLLEDAEAVQCLSVLRDYVQGRAGDDAFAQARDHIARVANGHRGSGSIDGAAHAAVSATYAVANALAGKAIEAASYAAYATVYAYGGYAVNDPASFEGEFEWQVNALRAMAARPVAGA